MKLSGLLFCSFFAYSVASNYEWIHPLTPSPNSFLGSSMACADDICYVTGGFQVTGTQNFPRYTKNMPNFTYPSAAVPSDAVLYFNMSDISSTSTWTPNPASLTDDRACHGSTIVWNSDGSNYLLYVVGGQTSWDTNEPSTFIPLDTVEYYNPLLGAWQYAHALPKPISKLAVAAINQTIYAVGGLGFDTPSDDPNGAFVYLKTVYTLDTTQQPQSPWQPLTSFPLPYAVFQASLTSFGSKLFLTGGSCFDQIAICEPGAPYSKSSPYPPGCTSWIYNNVLMYDTLGLNGWETLSPLQLARCTHGSFFDPFSLSLFVSGGAQGQFITLATVEVLTEITNSSAKWNLAPLQPIADAAAAWGGRSIYGQDSPLLWTMNYKDRKEYLLTKQKESHQKRYSSSSPLDINFPQSIALMTMGMIDETNSITSNITTVLMETT